MEERPVKRRLAAILSADVAGYSRLMEQDERLTLRTLSSHRSILDTLITRHSGRTVGTAGDSVLAQFASIVDALECAVAAQLALDAANAALPAEGRMSFRMALHVGDVIEQDGDVFGDAVNVAARLQALAEAGSVWISAAARDHVDGKVAHHFEDRGEYRVKNMSRPLRAFAIAPDSKQFKLPPEPPARGKPSVAVLPFRNLSGGADQDYFVEGVVEEIVTALSRLRWLFVIARGSTLAFREQTIDVREVGRQLGVRYVVEGSVRRGGGRVRLTCGLVETETGIQVWAERYDRELADIFDLQDEIAASIVGVLEPAVQGAEINRAGRKRTDNLDAYDLYLRALSHFHAMTREDNGQATILLDHALSLDPKFARAAALGALCYVYRIAQGWSAPDEARVTMAELASRALRLDRDDPDALACVSHSLAFASRHDEAIPLAERAISISPNSAFAWHNAGFVYAHAGRPLEAISRLDRALQLSPFDPLGAQMRLGLVIANLQLGRNEAALAAAFEATSRAPSFASGWRGLAASLALLGRHEEARAAAQRVLELDPLFTLAAWDRRFRFSEPAKLSFLEGLRKAGLPECRYDATPSPAA